MRARVQELENPEAAAPSVELYAPYAGAGAGASASSASASVGQARVQVPSYHHTAGMGQSTSHEPPSGSGVCIVAPSVVF